MVRKQIDCPFCEAEVPVMIDNIVITYKGVAHHLDMFFYRCNKCHQSFTTTETDKLTLGQIPDSIWSKELFIQP